MTNDAEERLQRGYRVIRLLSGESDSPWPGALLSGPTGEMAVAVDAALLGADWCGWAAPSSGHVLAPLDILRRTDGHDVLLPVCTERLEDFLARRGESDLMPGEVVTVAVSLLRGLAELQGRAHRTTGAWWLTEVGRPVFATDCGDRGLEDHTVELLRGLVADTPALADALGGVIDAISEPRRLARELERSEGLLFGVADPLALATTTFGPKRARDRSAPDAESTRDEIEATPPSWTLSLARHLDADWADLVSRTTTGVWRAMRTRRPGKRRPWLVAAGLAGAVLVGGLMWPTGPGSPATAEDASSSATGTPSPSAIASVGANPEPVTTAVEDAGESPEAVEPSDLVSITGALLAARTDCAQDETCLESVIETGATEFPSGVIDLPEADRALTLLDEFGGAAVLRAEAIDSALPPQLVVVVYADGRWLLRDVYGVAQQ